MPLAARCALLSIAISACGGGAATAEIGDGELVTLICFQPDDGFCMYPLDVDGGRTQLAGACEEEREAAPDCDLPRMLVEASPSGTVADSRCVELEPTAWIGAELLGRGLVCAERCDTDVRQCCARDEEFARRQRDPVLIAIVPSELVPIIARATPGPTDGPSRRTCGITHSETTWEPDAEHRGDVARKWLYFASRYSVRLSHTEFELLYAWIQLDPVSGAERSRNACLLAGGHQTNFFVF